MERLSDPELLPSGCIHYRHYLITPHALQRYIERIGGDVGDMINDIDSSWLFDFNRKGMQRRLCISAINAEKAGGYALGGVRAMFIVRAETEHVIVTTLSMRKGMQLKG